METKLNRAAWLLIITQVVHGAVPADTSSEGYVGLVVGLILLIASMVAVLGFKLRKDWAPMLTAVTGAVIAVGFVLYHALPFHTPATNPYFGEGVGVLPWLTVLACVAAGGWAAYLGFFAERRDESQRLAV